MADYTYTDADWRENAKYGLVGVTADDATEHWDRWLAEHDAKVRAEALREAAEEADDWKAADGMHGGEWFPSEWAGQVAGWLEHRAALIAARIQATADPRVESRESATKPERNHNKTKEER